jgi:hypothetical protein
VVAAVYVRNRSSREAAFVVGGRHPTLGTHRIRSIDRGMGRTKLSIVSFCLSFDPAHNKNRPIFVADDTNLRQGGRISPSIFNYFVTPIKGDV